VPKGHIPGHWKLIVDLSLPRGASVHDGIKPEVCYMHYTSVDVACKRIIALGRGATLAKFGVQGAFRTVPVHPEDRWLLGMKWEGRVYNNKILPFGPRSALKVFNAVADTLLWILSRFDGVDGVHCLDDFLLFGRPDLLQCAVALQQALSHCQTFGVPVVPEKTEGPGTRLMSLGIKIHTLLMSLRLPPTKLVRLQREIQRWGIAPSKSCYQSSASCSTHAA